MHYFKITAHIVPRRLYHGRRLPPWKIYPVHVTVQISLPILYKESLVTVLVVCVYVRARERVRARIRVCAVVHVIIATQLSKVNQHPFSQSELSIPPSHGICLVLTQKGSHKIPQVCRRRPMGLIHQCVMSSHQYGVPHALEEWKKRGQNNLRRIIIYILV